MAEYNTTVHDPTAILRGSGKLEISAVSASPSWVDVGAIQGLKCTEAMEVNAEENDNTSSEDKVTKQEYTVAGTMMEALRDDIRSLIRGDLDTRTATPASIVNDHQYVLNSGSWDVQTVIELDYQNAAGTCPNIDSVVASVNGALTSGEDYEMVEITSGVWGIIFTSLAESSALDTIAQNITIQYDYTPAASVKWQTGDKSTITKFMARITTLNDGNTFRWIGYYGNIKKGFELEYSKDDDNDRRVGMPFEFIFKPLPTGSGDAANEGFVCETTQVSGI